MAEKPAKRYKSELGEKSKEIEEDRLKVQFTGKVSLVSSFPFCVSVDVRCGRQF